MQAHRTLVLFDRYWTASLHHRGVVVGNKLQKANYTLVLCMVALLTLAFRWRHFALLLDSQRCAGNDHAAMAS